MKYIRNGNCSANLNPKSQTLNFHPAAILLCCVFIMNIDGNIHDWMVTARAAGQLPRWFTLRDGGIVPPTLAALMLHNHPRAALCPGWHGKICNYQFVGISLASILRSGIINLVSTSALYMQCILCLFTLYVEHVTCNMHELSPMKGNR